MIFLTGAPWELEQSGTNEDQLSHNQFKASSSYSWEPVRQQKKQEK